MNTHCAFCAHNAAVINEVFAAITYRFKLTLRT